MGCPFLPGIIPSYRYLFSKTRVEENQKNKPISILRGISYNCSIKRIFYHAMNHRLLFKTIFQLLICKLNSYDISHILYYRNLYSESTLSILNGHSCFCKFEVIPCALHLDTMDIFFFFFERWPFELPATS